VLRIWIPIARRGWVGPANIAVWPVWTDLM